MYSMRKSWGINIEFCRMQRNLILTKDGSHTVAVPEMNVTYHSIHGAIQESMHVFIDAGFRESIKKHGTGKSIRILEMGLGTGLNALLTLVEAEKMRHLVYYSSIELYPLSMEDVESLNYCEQLGRKELQPVFEKIHSSAWDTQVRITESFLLTKKKVGLNDFAGSDLFDLVYFDAFAPTAQPELWTEEVFVKLYSMMHKSGLLVTYCSKGDVRRAMQAAGFIVEKIPGPPGKREMVRARRSKE